MRSETAPEITPAAPTIHATPGVPGLANREEKGAAGQEDGRRFDGGAMVVSLKFVPQSDNPKEAKEPA